MRLLLRSLAIMASLTVMFAISALGQQANADATVAVHHHYRHHRRHHARKTISHGVAVGAEETGEGARATGRGIKKGAKATKHGVAEGAEETGEGADAAGRSIKHGAKATGHGIKKGAKATGHGIKKLGDKVEDTIH